MLHGIEKPSVRRENSLRIPLYEIRERDRVDVIVTNPPFGGEEERGIALDFPEAIRTSETALLFLLYIMHAAILTMPNSAITLSQLLYSPLSFGASEKEAKEN